MQHLIQSARHTLAGLVMTVTSAVPVAGLAETKDVAILLDFSASSPLLKSQPFARNAADRIATIIRQRQYGERLRVRTFGNTTALGANPLRIDIMLNSDTRPVPVAADLRTLVSRIPRKASTADYEGQKRTAILEALRQEVAHSRCDEPDHLLVVVITDGKERSALSQAASGLLPTPKPYLNQACIPVRVELLGIGKASDSVARERLRRAWEDFLQKAGAQQVRVVTSP